MRLVSASSETRTPGKIMPPRYILFGSTTSMVVAVPKSIRIMGASYSARAATAMTMRSLPTWLGTSMWMFSPVFSPGPTTMGCFRITLMTPVLTELNTGGTTEEMMQSSISFTCTPKASIMFLISTPYWSEVRMASVAMRALNRILSFSIQPMTRLVLPMSMASSITISP